MRWPTSPARCAIVSTRRRAIAIGWWVWVCRASSKPRTMPARATCSKTVTNHDSVIPRTAKQDVTAYGRPDVHKPAAPSVLHLVAAALGGVVGLLVLCVFLHAIAHVATGYGTAHGSQRLALAAADLMAQQTAGNRAHARADDPLVVLRAVVLHLHVLADDAALAGLRGSGRGDQRRHGQREGGDQCVGCFHGGAPQMVRPLGYPAVRDG